MTKIVLLCLGATLLLYIMLLLILKTLDADYVQKYKATELSGEIRILMKESLPHVEIIVV